MALTVWNLSETIVAEATTGQVTMTGRIGETVNQEEVDDDKRKTIVADVSQIGQGKLPKIGTFNTSKLVIYGYFFLLFFLATHAGSIRKKKYFRPRT